MRSYGQYCAVARALDVAGDRWSLLIARELLLGPCRYGELLDGLPGIATNLLADRLRQMEGDGIVDRGEDGRYRLTRWGEGLSEPLYALARWAAPVVMTRPAGDDAFRSRWLTHPVAVIFDGVDPRRPAMTVEVRTGDEPMTIQSVDGRVSVRPGTSPAPDVVLTGSPDAILGLLAGYLDVAAARRSGVETTGDARRLRLLRPNLDRPKVFADE